MDGTPGEVLHALVRETRPNVWKWDTLPEDQQKAWETIANTFLESGGRPTGSGQLDRLDDIERRLSALEQGVGRL